MTQPIAGPWLSPKVVTVNSCPNELLDTCGFQVTLAHSQLRSNDRHEVAKPRRHAVESDAGVHLFFVTALFCAFFFLRVFVSSVLPCVFDLAFGRRRAAAAWPIASACATRSARSITKTPIWPTA